MQEERKESKSVDAFVLNSGVSSPSWTSLPHQLQPTATGRSVSTLPNVVTTVPEVTISFCLAFFFIPLQWHNTIYQETLRELQEDVSVHLISHFFLIIIIIIHIHLQLHICLTFCFLCYSPSEPPTL